MRPVVIGTAGHIDHGKTALVRRLSGIDTDRLKEEKERGISIDLGFAHLTLPSGRKVALVDVPGHERFVKNMLAGATGIDLVLLVIAADEGVMPQTREHLAIVDLLGVGDGVITLTKKDLVAPEMLRLVEEEARALVEPTALRSAPIIAVSSTTGDGVEALLAELDRAVTRVEGRDASGPARLPIDRVFSVEGIGTVVTGTLWSGTVHPGDTLVLLPGGQAVRARQVEVHDQATQAATAGNRTAIALHGISREDVARGDWLAAPGRFHTTEILDARVTLLESARVLANRSRVRVHLGASETLARVVLLDRDELLPGASALAQLRLEGPVVAVPGDRLVLRAYSPSVTIAGARVIDANPPRRARLGDGAREALETLDAGGLEERVALLVRQASFAGARVDVVALRLGAEPAAVEAAASSLLRLNDGRWLDRAAWTALLARITDAVRRYGEAHKLRHGIPKGELKSLLAREIEGTVFDEALDRLLADRTLRADQDKIALPDVGPTFAPEQVRALEAIERRLDAAGFQVPDMAQLLREVPASARPPELARYLVESGRAVRVTSDLYYPAARWAEVEARVRGHFSQKSALTMGEFKDLIQVSRKYAVPLLEHLDRLGITRREGDLRVPGPRVRT
ncbi:MAG TPA: selenocysteine-specific translation elongation factor [Candidatus Eisenbacteria bacterium]|nr:selenocysteine-specific translation elongation factor [Candidatus Eisenbacteria bacterium]